jgi:hypothetical protein
VRANATGEKPIVRRPSRNAVRIVVYSTMATSKISKYPPLRPTAAECEIPIHINYLTGAEREIPCTIAATASDIRG